MKERKLQVLAALVLSALPAGLLAQADTLWTRTYGGVGNDCFYDMEPTGEGGFVLAGYTTSFGAGDRDGWLVCIDAAGDTLWTRTYGDSTRNSFHDIRATDDGGYVMVGETNYLFPGSNHDLWLVCVDASGDTLWTRRYSGGEGYQDYGYCIESTSDGGFLVGGTTNKPSAVPDGWLITDGWLLRIDANGDTLWTRTYGGEWYDKIAAIRQIGEGDFIVAGEYWASYKTVTKAWLFRINQTGEVQWMKTYGGDLIARFWDVACMADGGNVAVGSKSIGEDNYQGWLVRTDESSDTTWTSINSGLRGTAFLALQPSVQGGFAMAGWSSEFYDSRSVEGLYVLADSTGRIIRTAHYGGTARDEFTALQPAGDGGFVLAGFTTSFGAGGSDGWVVRTQYSEVIGIRENAEMGLVSGYHLYQNHPNPFNAGTVIQIEIAVAGPVRLVVYDILGREVARLVDGPMEAGRYELAWDGGELPSGIYIARLEAAGYTKSIKMVVLR